MFGGDEVGAMVVDMGSSFTRVGFAGEDTPKAVFPTALGVGPVQEEQKVGQVGALGDTEAQELKTGAASGTLNSKKRYYVGHGVRHRRDHMEVTYPLQDGLVTDWDGVERLWDHALKKHLSVDPADHPFMFSEPSFNTVDRREKMVELAFEKFNVPAVFVAKDAVLASFSVGRATTLVLDIGGAVTTAVPVHDGYVLQQGVQMSRVGGNIVDQVTERLIFSAHKRKVQPHYTIRREPTSEGLFKLKQLQLPYTTPSYHEFMSRFVVRDIKESLCRVSEIQFDKKANASIPTVPYELPDGNQIDIGTDRFEAPEVLFAPTGPEVEALEGQELQPGYEFQGVHSMVCDAVNACDVDIRKELSHVLVTGAGSLFPGLSTRLSREVNNVMPPAFRVKIVSQAQAVKAVASERKFASWIGGSILGSLGTFHQMWFSRAEYEEHGASVLATKCP